MMDDMPAKPDTRKGDRSATRTRPVRVSDDLWEAAKEKAAENGESLSDAIRRFLADYVGDPNLSGLAGSEMDRRSGRTRADG